MHPRIASLLKFVQSDVWQIQANRLSRSKASALKLLRVALLTVRGFQEDKIHLQASALTFYSLLSLVPVIAMAFGIAKGFGFDRHLEKQLFVQFPGQEEVIVKVIEFAQALLETTKGGLIAGVGMVVLFWAVIRVLGNIENAFNDVWGIQKSRSVARRFSNYLSIMLISPLLLILSGSVTVFLTTQTKTIAEQFVLVGYFSPLLFTMIQFFPYLVIWGLFTFLYMLFPNTRVHFIPALAAGILCGTAYQLTQWAYIAFQVGMARHNAIYGSFAALPLFLVWLQLSWLIVLLGAKFSYALQNADTHVYGPGSLTMSMRLRKRLSLLVCHCLVHAFGKGTPPLTAQGIALNLQAPVPLVRQVLVDLVKAHLVSEIKSEHDEEPTYQPALDIHLITIQTVLASLEDLGIEEIPIAHTPTEASLDQSLAQFGETIEKSPANHLLLEIPA